MFFFSNSNNLSNLNYYITSITDKAIKNQRISKDNFEFRVETSFYQN